MGTIRKTNNNLAHDLRIKNRVPGRAPVFSLAAAAAVVALAAAAHVVAVAAAEEQQNQDDDPPAVVATPRITAHNVTS